MGTPGEKSQNAAPTIPIMLSSSPDAGAVTELAIVVVGALLRTARELEAGNDCVADTKTQSASINSWRPSAAAANCTVRVGLIS